MAETIPCPACGTDNSPNEVRCHVCDYELRASLPGPPTGMSKCPRCGSGVASGAAFCQVCGQAVDQRHPRPHTGALNVRAMFGDQLDAPARAPIRQHTEIAPSANPPSVATFAPPGAARRPQEPARPAASRPVAPYMTHNDEVEIPTGPQERDSGAPRGRRRPAPRPRPNYAGFDASDSGTGANRRGAPSSPPAGSAAGGFSPVYADAPPRPQAAPRPQPHAEPASAISGQIDPGASASNLPRPRMRAEAHAEPIAARATPRPKPGGARPFGTTDQGFGEAAATASAHYGSPPQQSWGTPQPQRAALRLVLVGRDGQEGESFPLPPQGVEIGRHGGVAFPSDPFVSPHHAQITPIDGGVHLADLGSRNGVYLRLLEPTPVYPGDFFLLGNQLLRLDRLEAPWREQPLDANEVRGFGTPVKPPWAVLTRVCVGDIEDDRYHLRGTEITIGREQGEIVFPSDGFLSRAHARVRMDIHDNAMTVILEDLDSANGTYLRIRGAANVPYGGMFRVGDQIFRVRNN